MDNEDAYTTKKYHSATRKKEILPLGTTWMSLEGIMPSERIRERQILYDITYVRNLKTLNSQKR